MSFKVTDVNLQAVPANGSAHAVPSHDMILITAERAIRRIAPLWPLRHFVAVNPYLGLLDHRFEEAAQIISQRGGARMTAPKSFYEEAIRDGRVTDDDLEAALSELSGIAEGPQNVAELKAFALNGKEDEGSEVLPTVAGTLQKMTRKSWPAFVTESISRWAAAYFDKGQAYWKSPWSHLPAYAAWRAEAMIDRSPEWRGVNGFRQMVAQLPESAHEMIAVGVERLDVSAESLEGYFHRLLMTVHGWASYARYLLWDAELHGDENTALLELLAICLAWEVSLLNAFESDGIAEHWRREQSRVLTADDDKHSRATTRGKLLLQRAFEIAYQRSLFTQLGGSQRMHVVSDRKCVQAAFCIDVRSEVFRRALETVDPGVETIGFAGFFGFPIEYVRLGEGRGGAQCPVLLTPQFVIRESINGASDVEARAITQRRWMMQRLAKIWRQFKFGAVSCFGFVGPVGLVYVRNLLRDSLGIGRPVPLPAAYGLNEAIYNRLEPSIEPQHHDGRLTGITPEQRVEVAEGVLKAMSLTANHGRIVLLVGHGSTTVNNPYATGLDCGACGGHTGEANARVAARVLNDPYVRTQLKDRGIVIPEDTVFVGALHDTTVDEVRLFDRQDIPASHSEDLAQIELKLLQAGRLARMERAKLLRLPHDADVNRLIMHRSKDWSQVRPEWGLAGCAAFIVAPRERTVGLNLGGRTFLHSYDWQQDMGFSILELIMTAPMVVASWINLQYYGSTVDNEVFGSGNKVLHNVVGTLGVFEGNGGDLRTGLPWQSVHDGEHYVHEPLRLSVIIEAPMQAMNEIIARHDMVQQLVDHSWLHLYAMDDSGKVTHHYTGSLTWQPLHN